MDAKELIELVAKYGSTPILVVLAWRMWPTIEGWIRSSTGNKQARNRRVNDGNTSRINGNPCGLHEGLTLSVTKLEDTVVRNSEHQKDAIQALRETMDALSADLFPRMNTIEKDCSWIRGKLDRD